MNRVVGAVMAVLATAASLAAQSSTAEQLRRARSLYEGLEIERAMPLLRQVISPQWPFEVSNAERVEAYLYLGAALVLSGRRDSGVVYFRAALERDPFSELDPQRFTPAQLTAFARARGETFALATRPVVSARIDPRTQRLRFTFVATHEAAVRAELRRGDSPGVVLLADTVVGVREIAWDGLLADGHLAPPGRYELLVAGRSQSLDRSDSARTFFDLRHEVESLEDTLPALTAQELLPEQRPSSVAARDLATGLGVAGGVLIASGLLSNGELGVDNAPAAVVAGAAALTGVVALIVRARNRTIPENVGMNRRREAERAEQNAAVRARNAERVARTVLVISPAAGAGP